MEGDERTILGMIWILISRFCVGGITEGNKSAKDGLMLWCQKKMKGYKGLENTKNFNNSFKNGLAFCALLDQAMPGCIDFDSLDPDDAVKHSVSLLPSQSPFGYCNC